MVFMTEKQRSKPRPSAEWGRRAVDLAASIGKTKQDLARESGYTGGPKDPTIDRLMRGQGSLALAYAVRRTLKNWGLDVSKLPTLDDDEDLPEWKREWIALGDRLWQLADEKRFQVEIDHIRAVIHAHEVVAEGTGPLPKRTR